MTRWVPREPTKQDRIAAAVTSLAVAAGVGIVTFYVTRLFLARDALPEADQETPRALPR